MGISLCTFVKNESNCIAHMIESVLDYVDEIVVVDTGSTDNTIDICKKYTARIYQIPFTNFGAIRTLTAHLAQEDWVLMLDADETLSDAYILKNLVSPCHYKNNESRNAFAFPRKRWLDLEMTKQTELDAFPDYQVRFFRNDKSYMFRRELHEYFDGAEVHHVSHPIINHFHDVWKDFNRKQERLDLYSRLSRLANVSIEGGKVIK